MTALLDKVGSAVGEAKAAAHTRGAWASPASRPVRHTGGKGHLLQRIGEAAGEHHSLRPVRSGVMDRKPIAYRLTGAGRAGVDRHGQN